MFDPAAPLPRGPHRLTREQVAASQRGRLLAAVTTLVAERGYAAVTIGDLAGEAGVSRAAFYEHFADKQECLLAAYDVFAAHVVAAMAAPLDDDASWPAFVEQAVVGYLTAMESEPVAARAFLLEMDAAGPPARMRRREGVRQFAAVMAAHHAQLIARDPAMRALPDRIYLALAYGVRELVRDALEDEAHPPLTDLAPDVVSWVLTTVAGAGRG